MFFRIADQTKCLRAYRKSRGCTRQNGSETATIIDPKLYEPYNFFFLLTSIVLFLNEYKVFTSKRILYTFVLVTKYCASPHDLATETWRVHFDRSVYVIKNLFFSLSLSVHCIVITYFIRELSRTRIGRLNRNARYCSINNIRVYSVQFSQRDGVI